MTAPDRWEEFPTPITIGVVADTHLSDEQKELPAPLVEGLRGVDLILHAGDINTAGALRLFEALAPVRAVAGNNDAPDLQRSLPRIRYFRFGRFRVGLMHGHGVDRLTARQAAERVLRGVVDVAVFGHSHRPLCEWHDGFLLFNPGSATNKRWERRFSYGVLRIDDAVHPELHFY